MLFLKFYRIVENFGSRVFFVFDLGLKILIVIDKYYNCLFKYYGGFESSNFIFIDVVFCYFNSIIFVFNWKGNSVYYIGENGYFWLLVVC